MTEQLAKLPQGFKSIFNQGAAADYMPRLTFHPNVQRSFLSACLDAGLIQGPPPGEPLPLVRSDCSGTDPFQFAADCSITLVGKGFKEQAHFLAGIQFGNSSLLQQQVRPGLAFSPSQLAKLCPMLHNSPRVPVCQ